MTPGRLSILAAVFAATAGVTSGSTPQHPAAGDDLLIVDCLLPGQIRRLGLRTTYVGARQPVRTSARECRIRGGEYVSYDRADFQTSLAVWLPAAQAGDDEARVNVGTIFERGLGRPPDYAAAAHWYRLAAANGDVQAQLRIAHLYEIGLGVPQDANESLRWYRQAIGLGDAPVDLAPAPETRLPERALVDLEAQLNALHRENRQLRELVEEADGRLADATPEPAEQQRLREQVAVLQQALATRSDSLRDLEARYRASHEQYLRAAGERDAVQLDLARLRREHEARSEQARASAALHAATTAELERRLQENVLAASEQEARLQTLQEHLQRVEQRLAAVTAQREAVARSAADGRLAGPSLVMIDPRMPETRGLVQVTVPALARQQLIGRVDAPAGLLTLTLNGTPLTTNASGVFVTELEVQGSVPVALKAIDTQGKLTDLTFELRPGKAAPPSAVPVPPLDDVKLGNFHALVIGNDSYRHLPRLKTAVEDARAMSAVLEKRYGFETRLLIDADRYAILSALNDYRERLTADDNLLIYYAGHGELDEVNMRGHWLPVDAEADSTANWISNVAVTDVLNVMRARHVMLIVDSCYAASLTRSSTATLGTAMTDAERRNWIRAMAQRRARLVLSSGGLAPVLDAGGGRHSVFARALLEVLAGNQRLLDGRELYQEVAARVAYAASNVQFEQVPEFGPIRHAGHEAGAFFLVPRG